MTKTFKVQHPFSRLLFTRGRSGEILKRYELRRGPPPTDILQKILFLSEVTRRTVVNVLWLDNDQRSRLNYVVFEPLVWLISRGSIGLMLAKTSVMGVTQDSP